MSVILFYALLIGGGALAVAFYLGLLILPVGLLMHRFGPLVAIAFAGLLCTAMWRTFQPPFNGMKLEFVPPGMRPIVYISGMVSEPPIAMLLTGLATPACGLAIALAGWIGQAASRT